MRGNYLSANSNSGDRLSLTLFLSAVIHTVVILGVSFNIDFNAKLNAPSLEVTLVQSESRVAPESAEHIAQTNQLASGTTNLENRPSSPLIGLSPLPTLGIAPNTVKSSASTNVESAKNIIITRQLAPQKVPIDERRPAEENKLTHRHITQPDQRNLEIAQLAAEIAESEKRYAKRPRINYIDTLSAKTAVEATYIKAWVEKVEQLGNLNYPDEARRNRLAGSLILHVLLNNDGSVLKIHVGSPSGHQVLDDAAKRIVALASPFDPFPKEMRTMYDQLMITRTWVFQSGNALKTQ